MIWEPFVLALFLGLIVSAGLYFAYLWPSIEPSEEPGGPAIDSRVGDGPAATGAEEPAEPAPPSADS